jgi:hypothetical protein
MQERLARDNRSSLLRNFVTYGCKKAYNITPGDNVIILFMPVIYEFSYESRAFVRVRLRSSSGTNTLAYYENSLITDVKVL